MFTILILQMTKNELPFYINEQPTVKLGRWKPKMHEYLRLFGTIQIWYRNKAYNMDMVNTIPVVGFCHNSCETIPTAFFARSFLFSI